MVRGEVFDEATLKMVKDFLDCNTFNPKIALVRARPCDLLEETTRVSVLEDGGQSIRGECAVLCSSSSGFECRSRSQADFQKQPNFLGRATAFLNKRP
jgi:hypothetical protein